MRAPALLGFLIVALALWSSPASAAQERSFDPTPGVISAPPPGKHLHGDVLKRPTRAARRATSAAAENVFTTPDGMRVYVQVSDGYVPDPAADRALVNFLGSLLHGDELDGLRVYVGTPAEMPLLCGPDIAACYLPGEGRMFIVGEQFFGGLPTDYVTAHEYGHHVQNHRVNPPFQGGPLEWGTKRWASFEGVCPGVANGVYSLDYANDYFRHPGEANAEAFAFYHYPGEVPWEWEVPAPVDGSYSAIEADVLNPWRHNRTKRFRGRLRRNDVAGRRFSTPLDGTLKLTLRGPRRADFDLYLLSQRGRVLKKSRSRRSRERIRYLICGEDSFRFEVDAFRGSGRARVKVSVP